MRNTTERRQLIIEYIDERRRVLISDIAREFGISERTARNDVCILSCSYPIYTVQGHGGGVAAADGWYLSRRYLSAEQELLLRSLLPTLEQEDAKTVRRILDSFAKPKCVKK